MKPTLSIPINEAVGLLISLVILFSVAHILAGLVENFLGCDHFRGTRTFVRLFDLDEETSIPTWYATSMLLLSSVLLALIAFAKKADSDRYVRHWAALSIIFLCLSLDEAAVIHEHIGNLLRDILSAGGVLYFTWVIPGFIFVVIFVLAYLRFLNNLPSKTRRLFILAGFIFILGAIGIELIGAYHYELYGSHNLTYVMLTCVEESLEMLGIVIFIYALMSYISINKIEFRLCIRNRG